MVELTAEDMARYADECCKKAAELFDERKITREAVSEAAASMGRINGELLGRTMAAIQAGYAAGYTRYMEENRLDEDGFPTKAGAKTIDDCRKCKCNYCANLEQCKRRQKGKEQTAGGWKASALRRMRRRGNFRQEGTALHGICAGRYAQLYQRIAGQANQKAACVDKRKPLSLGLCPKAIQHSPIIP